MAKWGSIESWLSFKTIWTALPLSRAEDEEICNLHFSEVIPPQVIDPTTFHSQCRLASWSYLILELTSLHLMDSEVGTRAHETFTGLLKL